MPKCDHAAVVADAIRLRNQQAAAKIHGISRERVRQLCVRAGVDIQTLAAEERSTARAAARQASKALRALREAAYDANDPVPELRALCQRIGYVPMTTEMQRRYPRLSSRLRKRGFQESRILIAMARELGLARRPAVYGEWVGRPRARAQASDTS